MEKEILNLFINNIPQFVFWKDRQSNYLGCNENFAQSAGFDKPEELIGKSDYDLPWSTKEADFFRKIDQEVMNSGKPQINFEEPQTLMDGSAKWLSTSKVPIYNDQKEVVGILGWYIDITHYKSMEVQIGENNETLLEYNSQLAKSKKELEIANIDLEMFTYAVSHDLKSPIRTIVSFAELMNRSNKSNLNEDAQERLKYIIDAGKRMNHLVEDILSYARTGTEELFPEKTNVKLLVTKKMADFEQLIESNSAEVILDLPDTNIKCYPDLLGVVFYNLISNGLKFNDSDKPSVICKMTETETMYHFSVSDNGIGIDPSYAEKIFQPFKRVDSAGFEGSGLGLAICKRIVDIHHGEIWVEETPMLGSDFKFSISKKLKYLFESRETILSQSSYVEMFRSQSDLFEIEGGLGWDLSIPCCIGHAGNDYGTSTLMYFEPSTGIGRIIFSNISLELEEAEGTFYGMMGLLFQESF